MTHRGPCVNYDGQNPEDYDEYDSCSRHLAAARRRRRMTAWAPVWYATAGALFALFAVSVVDGRWWHAVMFLCSMLGAAWLADRLTT